MILCLEQSFLVVNDAGGFAACINPGELWGERP
jgi:hypothetical protein